MKFVKGMDLSTLLELEKCGAHYYVDGMEMDILDIMKKYDVDTIRIRLWNNPWSESGESYGAGENDLKTTLAIAKKVTDAGLGVLLNFHYSDFWADPGKQIKPKAWEGYSVEQLEQAVYDFTVDTMKVFEENGINTTMVQVGNELSNGLLWPEEKCQIMITLQSLSMQESAVCVQSTKMCRSCFILTMAVTMRFTVNGLTSLQSAVRISRSSVYLTIRSGMAH